VVAAIKRKELGDPSDQGPPKKRKKKGVNPLACLKKKPKPPKKVQNLGTGVESKPEGSKKKRKRNRKSKKNNEKETEKPQES